MTAQADWGLLLPFDSDDPEFTRGFEAGVFWARLRRDARWSQLIHAANAEMVMRMCEQQERGFRAETLDNGWLEVFVG